MIDHVAEWQRYYAEVRTLPPSKERLRRALIWGILTVHTPVKLSEDDFDRYISTGTMSGYLRERRARAIADVNTFVDGLNLTAFLRLPMARKLERIVGAVYGLGYAKTAFALTCAGIGDLPCLDVHALRSQLGRETRTWRKADAYLADCRATFGVRGAPKQWAFYYRLSNGAGRAFRRTSHRVVFQHLGVESARPIQARLGGDF